MEFTALRRFSPCGQPSSFAPCLPTLTSSSGCSLPRNNAVPGGLVVQSPGDGRRLIQGLVRGHASHLGEEEVGVEGLKAGYDLEAADVKLAGRDGGAGGGVSGAEGR